MYPVSAEVLAILNRGFKVNGRLRASVNGSAFTYPVEMESASVTVTRSSPIRRTFEGVIRARIDDAEVDVFRTEYLAEYGVEDISGNPYWIPVGTFVLTDANEVTDGMMKISGEDRWRRVVNARFLQPITTNGRITTAIKNLVEGADGRITCVDLTGNLATHPTSFWERDRDKAVNTLLKAIGAELVFNPTGQAEIRYAPGLGDPVAWIVGGGDGGVLINSSRGKEQGNTYNAAVVESEASNGTKPIRAHAVVTDPRSPLLYGGLGLASRPRYLRTNLINTQAQAQAAANAMLGRITSVARTGSLKTFPHPGLDGGDLLRIEVTPGRWENHLLEGFTIPLGPGEISITTTTNPNADEEGE